MEVKVIFSSKYGNTKRYADLIASQLGVEGRDINRISDKELDSADIILYGCGLYAGRLHKVDRLKKYLQKKVIVFTVGVFDPQKTEYAPVLDQNFSKEEQEQIRFFHLRGKIDYAKFSLKHRMMMWGVMNFMLKKIPEEKQSTEQKVMRETYGKTIDFFDPSSIDEIIEYVNG